MEKAELDLGKVAGYLLRGKQGILTRGWPGNPLM